jgi:quinol monooxygenase YgiN
MAYTLVVRLTAPEGEQDRAEELIRRLGEASRQEPGVVHYITHRDPEDPRVFLIYEQYRDQAAFEEHGQTAHFKELALAELFPMLENRERSIYETLD